MLEEETCRDEVYQLFTPENTALALFVYQQSPILEEG